MSKYNHSDDSSKSRRYQNLATKNKKEPCPNYEALVNKDYEVENVLDYKSVGDEYLVKWKDWPKEFNTWEPRQNLHSCLGILVRFFMNRRQLHYKLRKDLTGRKRKFDDLPAIPPDPRPWEEQLEEYFVYFEEISPQEITNGIEKFGAKFTRPCTKGRAFSTMMWNVIFCAATEEEMQTLRDTLIRLKVWTMKQQHDDELQTWSRQMTNASGKCPTIRVVNDVDFEGKPKEFEFMSKSEEFEEIPLPVEPTEGCSCDRDCFKNGGACCGYQFGSEFVYNRIGRLIAPVGTPIYECNAFCDCDYSCNNRQIKDGVESLSNMEYAIFRKKDDGGWGVKTLKPIRKGTFVSLIVGEIITAEEATKRTESKKESGMGNYIFDLDFYDTAAPYAIDFSLKGNVSHFINHSCSPNLSVYPAWTHSRNPKLPQLALFSLEDISEGTELTYSYVDVDTIRQVLKADCSRKYDFGCPPGFKACHCGSKTCVKFMKF